MATVGSSSIKGRRITAIAILCHTPSPNGRGRNTGTARRFTRGPRTASSAGRKVSPSTTEKPTTIAPQMPIDTRKVPR